MKKNSWRTVLTTVVFLGAMLPATSAVAADNENSVTSDTTKNPITGTVTETKKMERKHKHRNGKTSKSETEEKTRMKKDGSVDKTTNESETPANR